MTDLHPARLKVERLDGARGKDRFDDIPWGWSCFVCRIDYLCEEGWQAALDEALEHGLDHRSRGERVSPNKPPTPTNR